MTLADGPCPKCGRLHGYTPLQPQCPGPLDDEFFHPATDALQEMRRNNASHVLYERDDPNAPDAIKDSNGDIALGMCKLCGAGECELDENPCPHGELYRRLIGLSRYLLQITEDRVAPIQFKAQQDPTGRGLGHAIWMLERLKTFEDTRKMGFWVSYAQAILVYERVMSLNELRIVTRAYFGG